MSLEEDIENMQGVLNTDTDITQAIKELFKDGNLKKEDIEHHSIDIRTRLVGQEVRSMSIANFLSSINISGLISSESIISKNIKNSSRDKVSLAIGLNVLMHNLKRHKISMQGKSRDELVNLVKNNLETKNGGFLQNLNPFAK